jgi:hypothetical protein
VCVGLSSLARMQQELKDLKARVDTNEDKLDQTSVRVDALEITMENERMKNIYMFADHCERHDHDSNVAKAHCVLLTGNHQALIVMNLMVIPYILILGLKSLEFPKELAAQNVRANAMVHELIVKVLGREEAFTLLVRKGSGTVSYARDSPMQLLPPIEVTLKNKTKEIFMNLTLSWVR